MKPIAIDLFCGLGGWTDGLLAEGYYVVGFDIERHDYGTGGYPAQLVLQDVLTIHGKQFRDAALIVASPPCQEFSYMAMPWKRSKAIAQALYARHLCNDGPPFPEGYNGSTSVSELTALFDACFRIQREAIETAGHFIPLVVENVRGAIPWVGRSRWNYGSFHLWGDVPALMPMTKKFKTHGMNWSNQELRGQDFTRIAGKQAAEDGQKAPGFRSDGSGKSFQTASVEGMKTTGHANIRDGHSHTWHLTNQAESDGVKFSQSGAAWFDGKPRDKMLGEKGPAAFGSHSTARKAASAQIAKIPFALARHIARSWKTA